MRFYAILIVLLAAAAGFFLLKPRTITVVQNQNIGQAVDKTGDAPNLPPVPEAAPSAPSSNPVSIESSSDASNQPKLANSPEVVKGIYLTGWSAGSAKKVSQIINLIKSKGLNAVVVDIKDYSGHVSYAMGAPHVKESGAENEIRIIHPNLMVKEFHDNGIYVIGRITVFQDPILARAHPEWALKSKTTGKVWADRKGLAWMDPAAKPVWDYDLSIAQDALARGFDEINFDYVRFASDGDLSQITFPFWDGKTSKHRIIGNFFKYLREGLPDAKISADLFGLATVDTWDDLGIGQVIEDAYKYFDYVSPMVYPSHYAAGTLGYKNPASYPYEVIKYSMEKALQRLVAKSKTQIANSSSTPTSSEPLAVSHLQFAAKLRPWLQAFDLGAVYNQAMVHKEVKAVDDILANSSGTSYFAGYLFWDPANNYYAL